MRLSQNFVVVDIVENDEVEESEFYMEPKTQPLPATTTTAQDGGSGRQSQTSSFAAPDNRHRHHESITTSSFAVSVNRHACGHPRNKNKSRSGRKLQQSRITDRFGFLRRRRSYARRKLVKIFKPLPLPPTHTNELTLNYRNQRKIVNKDGIKYKVPAFVGKPPSSLPYLDCGQGCHNAFFKRQNLFLDLCLFLKVAFFAFFLQYLAFFPFFDNMRLFVSNF
jgi:hypothetical protein